MSRIEKSQRACSPMCQIPNSSLMTPFSACGSGGCRGVISVGSARKGRRSKEKEWRTRWKRGHEAPLAEASHSQEREPMSATHRTRSSRRPTERDGKAFWDAAQFDHHLTSSSGAYIASQPLCPREPSMGTFCPGKGDRRRDSEVGGDGRSDPYLAALVTQELSARPSVGSTAPVSPEQRG